MSYNERLENESIFQHFYEVKFGVIGKAYYNPTLDLIPKMKFV
jgi:hypothetical protein